MCTIRVVPGRWRYFVPVSLLLFVLSTVMASRADVLSAGSATVSPGTTFALPVTVSGATDLYAFQFDVSYDPSILQLESINEGQFLPSTGTTFFIPGTIDNTDGSATFTADTLVGPVSGAAGNGTLATFDFDMISVGTSPVALLNVILLDSNLNNIPFSTEAGQVSSVPEPSTMWLLCTGLILGGALWRAHRCLFALRGHPWVRPPSV